ncbi:MAG TPA: efflux RND transporter periplasmic adaptor subunit [Candidatus Solibacter sp.]|nr:efflux RND transporter periplasmic adaptor subunit [Candidatus Solibacter sp.]
MRSLISASPRLRVKITISLLGLLLSCSKPHEQQTSAAAPSEQRLPDGTVVIPVGSPKLAEIHTDVVRTAAVPFDEVVSPGKIEANPNLMSRVALPLAGRVSSVLVRLGDAVKRGDPILTIEAPDADAAVSAYLQAKAAINQAQANLNKAQADYDRSSDLFSHNAIAKKDVLTTENALAQAKAALDTANANLEQYDRKLRLLGLKPNTFGQKVTVAAPISGKVLEMTIAAGEYRNDTNTPVMTIADLSTVWVASDVPESQIRFIQPGEHIDVELTAYPGETFRGRVTRIADMVDPQTRTIKVRAEMDNSRGKLRPEMYGTIRHTDSMKTLPVVPAGAVLQGDGKSIVWVEQSPGRFQPVEVKAGERNGANFPILSGLPAGARIVVDGAMLLREQ